MKRLASIAVLVAAAWLAPAALAADFLATDEHLVVAPYPADTPWRKITDAHNSFQSMKEWIPADQSENAITDILTEQDFHSIPGTDPAAYVGKFLKSFAGNCKSARVNGPKAGTQNGYPLAYGQVYCLGYKDSGLDADIFIKAISGRKALYVVQREFRRPAQAMGIAGVREINADGIKAMTTADRFLVDGVQLCPLANGDQCPLDTAGKPQ